MKKILFIDCPKQLKNSFKTYSFLLQAQIKMQKFSEKIIMWNMSNTKVFDVNFLSVMYFIFEEQWRNGKDIFAYLPNKVAYNGKNILLSIFNYYAEDKRSFFKPRQISTKNIRETEDVLLKYLKKLELEKYDIIKTLISEIFANIKMHTENKVGYITGQYCKEENVIIVSIANADYSIARQLEMKRGMIFEDDASALLWTLKKSNSTRDELETGGLGLYLLRKYIYQLEGSAAILSGKCYLEFDGECFNPNAENAIIIKEQQKIIEEFQGTIITLTIPYVVKKKDSVKKRAEIKNINLLDMVGD